MSMAKRPFSLNKKMAMLDEQIRQQRHVPQPNTLLHTRSRRHLPDSEKVYDNDGDDNDGDNDNANNGNNNNDNDYDDTTTTRTASIPKRPQILDKILNTTTQRDDYDFKIYQQFLQNTVLKSQTNSNGLRVTLSWTYADDPIPNYYNCSLCTLFFFYTKVQLPATKLHVRSSQLTSDDEVRGRSCLSMYELFLLLRDFRIVPKLISREEVIFIWKLLTSMKKTRREETILLEFHDFQELFARIAILTFSKPMIQRIVLSTQGKIPSFEDQILALGHYIHLDDHNWIKNRLQTVGAHTISLINARSDERNPLRTELLRDEVKGKRLANWLAQGDLTSASSGGHVNIAQMKTILDSTYQNSQQNNPSNPSPASASAQAPAVQSKYKKQSPGHLETSTLLEQVIEQMKEEGQWSLESAADPLSPSQYATPAAGGGGGGGGRGIQYSSENHLFSHSTLPPNQSLTPAPLHTPSLLLLGGIKLSQTQEDALVQYIPAYTRVLDRYSDLQAYHLHKSTQSNPEREARGSDSGLLDMGILEEETDVIVRLHITNQTGYEMNVEINVDNIAPVEAMRITALPGSLAPGLSKTAYLTYTVPTLPERRRNYFFGITLHGISTQAINNTIHAVTRGETGVIPTVLHSRSRGKSTGGRSGEVQNTMRSDEAVIYQEFFVFSRIFPEEFFHTPPGGKKREGNGVPQASYQLYPHCTSQSLDRLYRMNVSPSAAAQSHGQSSGPGLDSRGPVGPSFPPSQTTNTNHKTRPKSASQVNHMPSRPLSGSPKKTIRNR